VERIGYKRCDEPRSELGTALFHGKAQGRKYWRSSLGVHRAAYIAHLLRTGAGRSDDDRILAQVHDAQHLYAAAQGPSPMLVS
jgi:hypothetical protein